MSLSKLILGAACCVTLFGCLSGGDSAGDAGTAGCQQSEGDSGTSLPTDSGVGQDDAGTLSPDSGVDAGAGGLDGGGVGVDAGWLVQCALCDESNRDMCPPNTACAAAASPTANGTQIYLYMPTFRCFPTQPIPQDTAWLSCGASSLCDDKSCESELLPVGTAAGAPVPPANAILGCTPSYAACVPQSFVPHDYVAMGGEVLDRSTGLTWSEVYPAASKSQAKTLCAGTGVWRIPTVHELYALKDKTKFNPASSFPGMTSEVLWSNTDGVNFFSGTFENPATAKFRCVKGP